MPSRCVQSLSSQCRLASSRVCRLYVRGGWTEAACLVHSHTNRCESADDLQTIKLAQCALWATDVAVTGARRSSPKPSLTLPFPTSDENTHIHKAVQLLTSVHEAQAQPLHKRQTKNHRASALRNHCLQTMCTVKRPYLYAVLCASRSLFLLLCWTSSPDIFLRSVICWIGPARPGSRALLPEILAELQVYAWKRNEPPWCPVLFLCEALTSTVETTTFLC